MLNPVLTYPAFRKHILALAVAFLSLPMLVLAQPQPQISGEDAVCKGSSYVYSTPAVAGNSWLWSVSSGGQITQDNGSTITVKWTGPHNSIQSVSVSESDGNLTGAAQLTVFIKKTVLSCENTVYVSLNPNGEAVLQPQTLLDGYYNTYEGFSVQLNPWNGINLGNTVTCAQTGSVLLGKVTEVCTGNVCYSNVVVEDHLAPVFICPAAAVQIPCDAILDSIPPPLVFDNCDTNVTVFQTGILVNNSNVCSGVNVVKFWTATDDFGNQSTCTQQLFINPLALVDFPPDTSWFCEDYYAHPNLTNPTRFTGLLSTTGSGVPEGASGSYCQYNYVHHDDTLAACGQTFKILRVWTVVNWCTGEVITEDAEGDDYEQVIAIMDTLPPVIAVPDFILPANINNGPGYFCASTGLLPAPEVSDQCGAVTVEIFTAIGEADYTNGLNGNAGGQVPAPGLPIGLHTIIYKATDACGNITELPIQVEVLDNVAPVAICVEYTVVTLDLFGFAEAPAYTFDAASHDNCCIGYLLARRMDDPDTDFDTHVSFSCDDSQVLVVVRVFDCFGNYNECMVTVTVQDKSAPTCIPPPAKIVNCTDLPPVIDQAYLNQFGTATFYDNCAGAISELPFESIIDACGQGQILRSFVAADSSGNAASTCFQAITVLPQSDWVIQFPPNWYGECGAVEDAEALVIDNFGCDMFATNFEDQIFPLANDTACYKIVRTWTVINWCSYDPDAAPVIITNHAPGIWIYETDYNNHGKYQYQQILKVLDTTPPSLSYTGSDTFCSFDENCQTSEVYLPLQVDAECSAEFDVQFQLDLNRDGFVELTGSGFFLGEVPLGQHSIKYYVTDGCSNDAQIIVDFEVKDCKPPTAICESGLIVELMASGMVPVCASAFDYGSYDNCPGPLKLSFSPDVSDTCRIFNCFDAYVNLLINLYVTDASGNQAFCTTSLQVQDNMFECTTDVPIQGLIATESNEAVENVTVQLNSPGAVLSATTDAAGQYDFLNLVSGQDYTVSAAKNDGPLNGVTTFDLVLISRHILQLQMLDSPYKIIAADANRSGSVTTFDLVEIRKLILFMNTDFPNNTSWRFVDKNYVFPNPANPFIEPFPEVVNMNNVFDAVQADFVAVKIGDVNNSADANANGGGGASHGERSSVAPLNFYLQNARLEPGKLLPVILNASEFSAVSGFQFTLDFDADLVEFQGIVSNEWIEKDNVGTSLLEQGAVTVSWYDTKPINLPDGQEVLRLAFRAKKAGLLSEAVGISSRYTKAEAYIGPSLDIASVLLQGSSLNLPQVSGASDDFQLFQNVPNPFTGKTSVGFSLPVASNATLTFFDASGKILLVKKGQFNAGRHEIEIDKQELGEGMVYYRLETPGHSAAKAMNIVKK